MLLYDKLIAEYPGTEGAALAEKGKQRIVSNREKQLKKDMRDQVARLLLALNGYQSMYGKMPASISDLDENFICSIMYTVVYSFLLHSRMQSLMSVLRRTISMS